MKKKTKKQNNGSIEMVSIIMGSKSDYPVMKAAEDILQEFSVPYEVKVVSAHRTPEAMLEFAKKSLKRGVAVIIAGAGGAAHLPGMVASITTLPVIGVPILSANSLDGMDSILSILQMPKGIPVATVALNGAENAGLLAVQILAIQNEKLRKKMEGFRKALKKKVEIQNKELKMARKNSN